MSLGKYTEMTTYENTAAHEMCPNRYGDLLDALERLMQCDVNSIRLERKHVSNKDMSFSQVESIVLLDHSVDRQLNSKFVEQELKVKLLFCVGGDDLIMKEYIEISVNTIVQGADVTTKSIYFIEKDGDGLFAGKINRRNFMTTDINRVPKELQNLVEKAPQELTNFDLEELIKIIENHIITHINSLNIKSLE